MKDPEITALQVEISKLMLFSAQQIKINEYQKKFNEDLVKNFELLHKGSTKLADSVVELAEHVEKITK